MIADDRAPAAPAPEPDRTPRANRILSEPATAERCAADRAAAGTGGPARDLLASARGHGNEQGAR